MITKIRNLVPPYLRIPSSLVLALCIVNCALCIVNPLHAQDYNLRITLQDNSVKVIATSDIASIHFEQTAPPALDYLTGEWMLVAMPNGAAGEGNIHTAKADTIHFQATPSTDGLSLICHTDNFYDRSGQAIPADWMITVEQDETGSRRLGVVLSEMQPASTAEFQYPREKYLDNGFFYWGDDASSDAHHYIYLLSENISTQRLEGMTLWSNWEREGETTFTLPQNQEIYGVVASEVPYSDTSIGYFEIWASPRLIKVNSEE